ncbi:hypothetical protein D0N42_08290, partial [Micrococcus luteus]
MVVLAAELAREGAVDRVALHEDAQLPQDAGSALGTFLVILIVAVGIGVLVWIFGKLSSSGRAQDVGISFVVWG